MRKIVARVLVSIMLAMLACRAHAADAPPPQFSGPYPVELEVGEIFEVCKSGEIICPATHRVCDDLNVADLVDTPEGLGIRGVAPGTTLCAASGVVGPRRVFRITVR